MATDYERIMAEQPGQEVQDKRVIKCLLEDLYSITLEEALEDPVILEESIRGTFEKGHKMYTCKLYIDGICSEHETRPDVCRKFPNSRHSGNVYLTGCKLAKVRYPKVELTDEDEIEMPDIIPPHPEKPLN
jgi:Fe-S-cluster containining protein